VDAFCNIIEGLWLANIGAATPTSCFSDFVAETFVLVGVENESVYPELCAFKAPAGNEGTEVTGSSDY